MDGWINECMDEEINDYMNKWGIYDNISFHSYIYLFNLWSLWRDFALYIQLSTKIKLPFSYFTIEELMTKTDVKIQLYYIIWGNIDHQTVQKKIADRC